MTRLRRDIWELPADANGWSEPLHWYAKAVIELQKRPIADRTSWRYLAAMHGINEGIWRTFGIIQDGEPLPDEQEQRVYWRQCQHQTWFFLPWHRGYLASFEAIVRKAIVALDGPADWALPYWNYNNPNQPRARTLPDCFYAATLPDGTTPNPLRVERRFGDDGHGRFEFTDDDIDIRRALEESDFFGTTPGASPGFGGMATRFAHYGRDNGRLESSPHNNVHGIVGGYAPGTDPQDPVNSGLMSRPTTAALDPVFWLHHSNIDRLWEVWLARNPEHANPVDQPQWANGTPLDNRGFIVPDTEGRGVFFTPADMLDTTAPHLDYTYEDVSDPLQGETRLSMRALRLDLPIERVLKTGGGIMATKKLVEMIGANDDGEIRLDGVESVLDVRLDTDVALRTLRSFETANLLSGDRAEPDRIFLNLENIRGANDAQVLYVYVRSDGAPDAEETCVGAISLFGITEASRVEEHHGGNGLSAVLEISDVYDRLGGGRGLDASRLKVRIASRDRSTRNDDIRIGRISLYRQQE